MRVCMFVHNPLTHDARVFREAATLAGEGHEVTVIGVMRKGLRPIEPREGFTIHRIPRRVSLGRRVRRRLRSLRGAPPLSPRRRPSGLLGRWLTIVHYWRRGYRLTAELPVADVYHANDLNTLPLALAAAKRAGAPVVYDSHELFPERPVISALERPIWRLIERRMIGRADRVITVNEFIAEELVRRYGIALPLVLLNCPERRDRVPAEGSSERLRRWASLTGNEPIVLYQGRIGSERRRGLKQLIEASKSFEHAAVVILGQGPAIPELQAMIDSEGLGDRVKLPGPVPPEELLSYTAGATIGVIPQAVESLNTFFTSPNKLFEYMAAGLPVVATKLPVLERIVVGHDTGLVYEPDDVDGLAAAINRLLGDEELYERCRRNTLEASKIFNWEEESKKFLALYEELGGNG